MSPRKRPDLTERSSSLHAVPDPAAAMRPKHKIFDWISGPRMEKLTSFQQSVVDVDWKNSPLGPMASWPAQLRHIVLMVVADPTPAVVYWGNEDANIYNVAYIPLIGSKHPALQGKNPKYELAEVWDYFAKLLQNQRENGHTVIQENQPLVLIRHGFVEEAYFSWKFVPIVGDQGYVIGSYHTVVEVTREVISQRRLSAVRGLSRDIAVANNIKGLWSQIMHGLEQAEEDIPLAMLYSIMDRSKYLDISSTSETFGNFTEYVICHLEGTVGLPGGHPIAPAAFDLLKNENCPAKSFRRAMRGPNFILVQVKDEILEEGLLEGINWRDNGEPGSAMVVCPIFSTYSNEPVAFLVIALNPRRPYDADYQSFIHMLTKHITTPQISAILLREEVFKHQKESTQEAID
jgi:hypothetical protein